MRIEIAVPLAEAGGRAICMRSPVGRAADKSGFSVPIVWPVLLAMSLAKRRRISGVSSLFSWHSILAAPMRSTHISWGLLTQISETSLAFRNLSKISKYLLRNTVLGLHEISSGFTSNSASEIIFIYARLNIGFGISDGKIDLYRQIFESVCLGEYLPLV